MRFTKSKTEAIPFLPSGQKIYWDDQLPGFGLLVSKKTKSFIAQRDLNGRSIRVKVGTFPNIHPDIARKAALDVINQISCGIDPRQAKKQAKLLSKSLISVADDYLETKKDRLAKGTVRGYRDFLKNHLSDWKTKDLRSISNDMVISRFGQLSKQSGKIAANNCMQFLGALYNYAAIDDETLINPVQILKKKKLWHPKTRRKDVISDHQIAAWYQAVLRLPNTTFRDAILTAHWTGLRKNEVFRLRWEHVDFKAKTILIPETKNGEPLKLPMTNQLQALLQFRQGMTGSDGWVFKGPGVAGHVTDPKKSLKLVEQESGVACSMHTLRRTFITAAEKLNISPYTIKALINHRSGGDVTGGYVIMTTDRLRSSAQQVVDELCRLSKASR